MTDEELVARAIWQDAFPNDEPKPGRIWDRCQEQAAAVVAALTQAGRLVPDGAVAIERDRWERVRTCRALKHLTPEALVTMQGLHPGDLDAE